MRVGRAATAHRALSHSTLPQQERYARQPPASTATLPPTGATAFMIATMDTPDTLRRPHKVSHVPIVAIKDEPKPPCPTCRRPRGDGPPTAAASCSQRTTGAERALPQAWEAGPAPSTVGGGTRMRLSPDEIGHRQAEKANRPPPTTRGGASPAATTGRCGGASPTTAVVRKRQPPNGEARKPVRRHVRRRLTSSHHRHVRRRLTGNRRRTDATTTGLGRTVRRHRTGTGAVGGVSRGR